MIIWGWRTSDDLGHMTMTEFSNDWGWWVDITMPYWATVSLDWRTRSSSLEEFSSFPNLHLCRKVYKFCYSIPWSQFGCFFSNSCEKSPAFLTNTHPSVAPTKKETNRMGWVCLGLHPSFDYEILRVWQHTILKTRVACCFSFAFCS